MKKCILFVLLLALISTQPVSEEEKERINQRIKARIKEEFEFLSECILKNDKASEKLKTLIKESKPEDMKEYFNHVEDLSLEDQYEIRQCMKQLWEKKRKERPSVPDRHGVDMKRKMEERKKQEKKEFYECLLKSPKTSEKLKELFSNPDKENPFNQLKELSPEDQEVVKQCMREMSEKRMKRRPGLMPIRPGDKKEKSDSEREKRREEMKKRRQEEFKLVAECILKSEEASEELKKMIKESPEGNLIATFSHNKILKQEDHKVIRDCMKEVGKKFRKDRTGERPDGKPHERPHGKHGRPEIPERAKETREEEFKHLSECILNSEKASEQLKKLIKESKPEEMREYFGHREDLSLEDHYAIRQCMKQLWAKRRKGRRPEKKEEKEEEKKTENPTE